MIRGLIRDGKLGVLKRGAEVYEIDASENLPGF